eukprot:jgi/Undpi1/9666/HiC_scaffold_27.g12122.m1
MVSATFGEKINTDRIVVDKTAKEVLQEEYSEALSANPGFLEEVGHGETRAFTEEELRKRLEVAHVFVKMANLVILSRGMNILSEDFKFYSPGTGRLDRERYLKLIKTMDVAFSTFRVYPSDFVAYKDGTVSYRRTFRAVHDGYLIVGDKTYPPTNTKVVSDVDLCTISFDDTGVIRSHTYGLMVELVYAIEDPVGGSGGGDGRRRGGGGAVGGGGKDEGSGDRTGGASRCGGNGKGNGCGSGGDGGGVCGVCGGGGRADFDDGGGGIESGVVVGGGGDADAGTVVVVDYRDGVGILANPAPAPDERIALIRWEAVAEIAAIEKRIINQQAKMESLEGQESSIAYSKCKSDIDTMSMDKDALWEKVNSAPNTKGLGGFPGLFAAVGAEFPKDLTNLEGTEAYGDIEGMRLASFSFPAEVKEYEAFDFDAFKEMK